MALNCQRCGTRPATIHLTEVLPTGTHQEAHPCSACCQQAGWSPEAPPPAISDLLAGKPAPHSDAPEDEGDDPACPECGLKLSEYQQVNLFGCRHDYASLGDEVVEMIKRWHGADRHVGRKPGDTAPGPVDTARADLEARLAAAVSGEHYEEAARLRDELRRIGPA